jgi:nucleotide-binding universal stress UspA family protein
MKKGRNMKILIGFNGYYVSKDAVALALKHAKAFNASVDIVTMLEKGHALHLDDMEKADTALDEAKDTFDKLSIPCRTKVITNKLTAGENLVAFSRDHDIDMLIIGIKRRSKVSKMLLGSTAQYVILNAPCPVLSIQ